MLFQIHQQTLLLGKSVPVCACVCVCVCACGYLRMHVCLHVRKNACLSLCLSVCLQPSSIHLHSHTYSLFHACACITRHRSVLVVPAVCADGRTSSQKNARVGAYVSLSVCQYLYKVMRTYAVGFVHECFVSPLVRALDFVMSRLGALQRLSTCHFLQL